jgi:hypothetical protein
LGGRAFAETVRLKNGKVIEGELIEKTPDYVKMKVEGLDVTYWKDEMENQVEAKKQVSPKEVYLAYYVALEKKDWPQMKKYLTEDLAKQKEVSPGEFAPGVFRKFTVNTMNITKESPRGDSEFFVTSKGQTTQGVMRHRVDFKKIGDEWRIDKELWLKGEWKKEESKKGGSRKGGRNKTDVPPPATTQEEET